MYVVSHVFCVTPTDINECEVRDTCQHECMNTPGSYRCVCPAGYRLMTNGKTCQGDYISSLSESVQLPHLCNPTYFDSHIMR